MYEMGVFRIQYAQFIKIRSNFIQTSGLVNWMRLKTF